jgi:mRNA interferase MazF
VIIPKRGEIYWLNFSPATGSEMKELHPALVIQNDIANKVSALTIIAAITSNLKVAALPVGIVLETSESGLNRKSVVHLGQLYTVDKTRLGKLVAQVPSKKMEEVDKAIKVSLGLAEFKF